MPRPSPPRPYHHGDLKRALLETGIAHVQEHGVESLSVAELGRRVGVSSAAPYKHFPDRLALLRAISTEGNRRLGEALIAAVGDCTDPEEAFRLTGVAYIRWAAENPALFRLASDPALIDYNSRPPDVEAPEPLQGSLEPFWTELAKLVRSGEGLEAKHPVIQQLRGRALAQGIASYFVSGVFASLGISTREAERIARAVTGEDVPARGATARRETKRVPARKRARRPPREDA